MGLFSKLLGENSELGGLIKDVANAIKQESVNLHESEQTETESTAPANTENAAEEAVEAGPSGFSWGPVMPAEENQYNYKGTYKEYFSDLFRSEFSGYRIESTDANNGRITVFTFWSGDRKALVVELLSRKSSVYKLRSDCAKEGVAYLRYYYDYHGWWNTREYVKQRTRKALEG
ncbi:MAG: hypothetical protein IKH78_02610 [Ruminococcus sp.]|nr:hypothetical protein [Ruminococcus sp.]